MKTALIGLFVATGIWWGFMKIYNQNQTIKNAYNSYFERNYESSIGQLHILSDSLELVDPGIQLNIAHSTYQLNNFSGANGTNFSNYTDSLFLKKVEQTFYEYAKSWESDPVIASRGYNQAGILTFKSRVVNNAIAQEEPLIDAALNYFKSAVRTDFNNEKARYNYEILKKYKEFPEQVMNRVRSLVSERRYEAAYNYLAPFVETNGRFSEYADYSKRLGDIVKIENQYEGS